MPIAAAAVDICQPTAKKKRKEVGVAASNGSGPSKKRVRKRCSAEGCSNQSIKGGVCYRHGAKREIKLCSVGDCTNQAQREGVCWRHGAKVEVKRCSVDDCKNQFQKGGVCWRHGAQKKLCSVGDCTKYPQNGGVCIKHGAKVQRKLCSVEECTNQVVNGGVCIRHGANGDRCKFEGCTLKADFSGFCSRHQEHHPNRTHYNLQIQQQQQQQQQILRMGLASTMSSLGYRHHPPQWNNNYYYDNSLLNSNRVSHCNFEGCNIVAMHGGFCSRHWTHMLWTHRSSSVAPHAHADSQRGYVQGGGNQHTPTVEIISDDEGAGEKKQSSITSRKRKEGVAKQSETAISSDTGEIGEQNIPENKYAAPEKVKDKPNSSSVGDEGNSKDDKEPGTSDQEIAEKKDVAPTQGGSEEGAGDAMEDGDSWGGDGQNEYDCGGGDDGDVNSEEGKQSHVVPDEIVATDANDVENDSEIQRLATELKDANKTVDTLNDRLKEFEAAQSRSKSEHEQQQSELKDLRNRLDTLSSQLEKKTEDAARLEASLRSKEVEMQSAVLASAAQLKEANDKVAELSAKLEQADKDGNEKIQRQINKFHSMQQDIRSLQSNKLRLEQQLRSSKSEQDNLKSALAKAASKNQTHCTRSTSITSSRKRFSKKNRLVGVDSLSTLEGEGTTSITSSRKRLGKKNRLLGLPILSTLGEEGTTSITSSRKRRGKKNRLLGVPFLSTLGEEGSR